MVERLRIIGDDLWFDRELVIPLPTKARTGTSLRAWLDPVRVTFELLIREINGLQREMIIAGGSRGMEGAIRDLLGNYLGVVDRMPPSLVPVIALQAGKHTHACYGPVKTPLLPLVDWLDPVTGKAVGAKGNGRTAAARGKAEAVRHPVQVELDDQIPF